MNSSQDSQQEDQSLCKDGQDGHKKYNQHGPDGHQICMICWVKVIVKYFRTLRNLTYYMLV